MYLWTEVLYLLGGVSDHLDAVLVGGHGAGEVGHLHQLVAVLGEDEAVVLHLLLLPRLGGFHQDRQGDTWWIIRMIMIKMWMTILVTWRW